MDEVYRFFPIFPQSLWQWMWHSKANKEANSDFLKINPSPPPPQKKEKILYALILKHLPLCHISFRPYRPCVSQYSQCSQPAALTYLSITSMRKAHSYSTAFSYFIIPSRLALEMYCVNRSYCATQINGYTTRITNYLCPQWRIWNMVSIKLLFHHKTSSCFSAAGNMV